MQGPFCLDTYFILFLYKVCQYLMGAIVEDVRTGFEGRGDALVTIPEYNDATSSVLALIVSI